MENRPRPLIYLLFRALPKEDLSELARWVRVHRLEAGEVLYLEGDPAEARYGVAEG